MVNFLFISNNARIHLIKNMLQPFLKVKIDIVGDFDYGLKDVFEKRPALVFIQDQIAGVTGESVARHIQMLLGNGSPTFIFLHEGNSRAKPIHGLYEYLIDLSQADNKVLSDIQDALKALLGPQWQKVYISSNTQTSEVAGALSAPDQNRIVADKLIDDLISDLQGNGSAPLTARNTLTDSAAQNVPPAEPLQIISSPHDQLSEILSESADKQPVEAPSGAETATPVVRSRPSGTSKDNLKPSEPETAVVSERPPTVTMNPVSARQDEPPAKKNVAPLPLHVSGSAQAPQISPADFRIERERVPLETAPEDALRAFEIDYQLKSVRRKWYQAAMVLVLLCLSAGGWLFIKQNLRPVRSVTKESAPVAPALPATPVSAVQKAVSTTHRPEKTAVPSFIPLAGLDPGYASQKPGWERYVGTEAEFRVFRTGGKLKAIQVVASKGRTISDTMLRSMLIEITGDGQYLVTHREQKLGFQVLHARVDRKADLLMYRKKSAVSAVVISLD